VTQAIADVERMEREEQANRKAMLEAKALLGTKVEEISGAAEDVKTLMEMPVLVENSVPEPHAVAQVIEVPAQGPSTGNLDIIIVDSSTLGGQEEVPPDTGCQLVEVVLDPKSSDGSKQDAASSEAVASLDPQETFSTGGEQDIPLNDHKAAVENEQEDGVTENTEGEPVVGCSPDGTVMSGTVAGEDASVRELGMDEGSRIALVAIQIPTAKAEEKEICKTDKNEELTKQMEQNIKKNEDEMMKEEIKQDTTSVETSKLDEAVNIEDQKEKYNGMNELQASEEQGNERNETAKEVVVSDVKRVAAGESSEDKAEESAETEKHAGGGTGDEQCVLKEEDMLAAEHSQESAKRSEEEEEKRDTEVEDLVTQKISEATEEEDSHAESSEDEKKTDEKAVSAEEENARLMAFCFLV